MSDNLKDAVTRRRVLAALYALAGAGVVGGIVYKASNLSGSQGRRGGHEDLVSLLPDQDDAATVGLAVLAGEPAFEARRVAQELRQKLGQRPLSAVLGQDMVQGRVVETNGWVLPETLAELCALAAKAA